MNPPNPSALHSRNHSALFLFLFAATICFCKHLNAQELLKTNFTAFKTNFSPGSVLSKSEIETALRLAKMAGVTNVAEVTSVGGDVVVKGNETIYGRRGSFVSVGIVTGPLWPSWDQKLVLFSDGNSHVLRYHVQTNTFALFKMNDHTIHVRLDPETSLEDADQFIASLAAKKIRYANEPDAKAAEEIDLFSPKALLRSADGKWRIGFSPERWSHITLYALLDQDGILITHSTSVIE
jgi:hypothetical protein